MIRSTLALLLFAAASLPLAAQAPAPASGCGDPAIHFDVATDRGLHPAPPTPGRALVYFVQDDNDVFGFHKPIVRIGLDGKWVAATHGSSYLFFYVEPGEHSLCTNWQDTGIFSRKAHPAAALQFSAKPGATYYFQVTNSFRGASRAYTAIMPVTPSNPEDYLADYEFALFHQLP